MKHYFAKLKKGSDTLVDEIFCFNEDFSVKKVSVKGITYPKIGLVDTSRIVNSCLEISVEQFNKLQDEFVTPKKVVEPKSFADREVNTHMADAIVLGYFKNLTNPKKFTPVTKFDVLLSDGTSLVTGFSDKSREELSKFLCATKGKMFRAVDKKGLTRLVLSPSLTLEVSYLLTDYKDISLRDLID